MKSSRFPKHPILIVDDEEAVVRALSAQLKSNGIQNLAGCQDSREVMDRLHGEEMEIVLLDLSMPYVSGRDLLRQIHEEFPFIPVIVVTAANEVQTAVECMKAGAFDYLVKAVKEEQLVHGVRRAIELRELKREYSELRSRFMAGELSCPQAFSRIITRSSKMKSIFLYIEAVAKTGEPVLITGETGVGKDLIAQAIHRVSGRTGDLVAVNVALPEKNILADDLFGHTKGSFTSADSIRDGFTQRAKGGTLFLDEIGDLSREAQVTLLKFLDTGEYYPIGSDFPRRSDARIILATNRNLEDMIENGLFRKDLYYRISTHEIHVPPLRERSEDLPLLLEYFTTATAADYGRKELSVPAGLAEHLSTYPFPGNVRELQKLIKDAVAVADPSARSLPVQTFLEATRHTTARTAATLESEPLLRFGPTLPPIEHARKLLTDEALRRTGGNITEAARLLGVSHQALSKWLQRRK